VNISAKTEYACIAVLELAARQAAENMAAEPVRIRDIADRHGIPSRFLVQILLQLKAAGLVASVRGATGGYRLARAADEITLLDVMNVVDGQSGAIKSSAGRATATVRALTQCWKRVAAKERELLAAVTFADLAEQLAHPAETMYHI
jgi:Rrf2 family protein